MKIPSTDYVVKELIDEISEMRFRKNWSMGNLHKYLENKYGLNKTRRWELIKLAKEELRDYQQVSGSDLEEAIESLETMLQEASERKDHKLAFNIRREISDIKGLKKQQIEIQGKIEMPLFGPINDILPDVDKDKIERFNNNNE